MPQAVVFVAQAVTSAAMAFGAASAGALLAASYIGVTIGYATVAFALNKAMSLLTPKPKSGAGRGLEVSVTDSAADGFVIYGKIRCAGVNVIPPLSSGSDGRYLHQVLALAIHEVDGFDDVYFNQEAIANSSITAVTGSSTDGRVTSGTYANAAWVRRYRGTATQTVDYILNQSFPSAFTSDFRGRGIAYAAIQYDWGKGKVYTSGVPQVTFVVRGKRCYDPRLDSSPGANPTNPSYQAWTENPALCWADFMMADYGYACAASDIDWSTVVDAANVCDATVTTPAGSQKRYTCNGRLSTGNDPEANMRTIVDCMLGKVAQSGGKYRIFAGAWRAPEFAIGKEDWLAIKAIQTTSPRDGGRFNGVVCYIVNPDRNWQRVETYRRFSDTYKSADAGERIWIETEQPMCIREYEGQRKAEFILRQSRNGIRIAGTLPPRFMKLRMWDNVTVSFDELGWTDKTFTVSALQISPSGTVDVVLSEEQSGDWADLTNAEYNAPSSATLPTSVQTTPHAPANFQLSLIGRTILAQWEAPEVVPANTQYQLWAAPFSLSDPASKVLVREGDFTAMTLPLATTSPYWYQVRAISNSAASPYTPNTYGVGIAYSPPEGGSWGLSVAPSFVYGSGYDTEVATDLVTVTVTGSVNPSFAWTRPNSYNMSISNSTANVVYFYCTSMTVYETRQTVWRCTVIDGTNSGYIEVEPMLFRDEFFFGGF